MLSGQVATAWIDTNVLVEMYSHGDLQAACYVARPEAVNSEARCTAVGRSGRGAPTLVKRSVHEPRQEELSLATPVSTRLGLALPWSSVSASLRDSVYR